jgi:archaellum component FlaC
MMVMEVDVALTAQDMMNIKDLLEDVITRRVDPRFERVEERLDRVEERLDRVEQRLDGVENRLGGVENRLQIVEHDVRLLRDDMGVVTGMVKEHGFEISRLKHRAA